jgi:excisionase family DNA binding protein
MRVLPGQLSLDLDCSLSHALMAARTAIADPCRAVPSVKDEPHADAAYSATPPGPARSAAGDGVVGLLTVAEVGRLTGLSLNAVYRAIWSGELRASKLRGRIRVSARAVDAWVEAGAMTPRRAEPVRSARARRAQPASRGRGLRELLEVVAPPGA